MQESGAKRPDKPLQRDCTEENDRADTLSDACQVGITDGDVPVSQSKLTKSAEAPEATQEDPLMANNDWSSPSATQKANADISTLPKCSDT